MMVAKGLEGMRKYIRHPVDIPIEFDVIERDEPEQNRLRNISLGGIAFHSSKEVELGRVVTLRIPPIDPAFTASGRVVWVRKLQDGYDVGVTFLEPDKVFEARMVEQVCYIEHYQKEVLQNEGRELTLEEATQEWITKFADKFPADD
jgi:hypothetical protein